MGRFDVYANPSPHSGTTPWLLDVQSELLTGLDTRVVVPLRLLDSFPVTRLPVNLTPVFRIEGRDCLMETPKLAALPTRVLKLPIASLAEEGSRIIAALDFLFQGY